MHTHTISFEHTHTHTCSPPLTFCIPIADSGGVKLPSPCGTVTKMGIPDAESDFNQWLHAMKMVARLPGGMPPDFRRKVDKHAITFIHCFPV